MCAVAVCAAATSASCGGDDAGDGVPISIAVVAPGGNCAAENATQTVADLAAASMRLTVVVHHGEGDREIICDELVDLALDEGVTPLAVDTSVADRVDLLVEAFDDAQPPNLVASGVVLGINRRPRLEPLAVLLARAGSSSCTPGPLATARAFHSATALPNGEVLIIGGVAPAAAGGFAVQPSIEVYDPGTGLFKTAVGDLPEGRAFHTAMLLDPPSDQSAFDVLLVGGVTAADASQPVIAVGSETDALPFVPLADARAADSVIVRYFPWTDPPQVQQMTSPPHLLGRLFHTATAAGSEVLVAGGIRAADSGLAETANDLELISPDATHRGPYPLARARVGAVAAPLGEESVLVFGGNLLSDAAELSADAAEIVALADGQSEAATFEPESVSLVTPVAHATLTPIADGLLLAGGLQVESGSARTVLETNPVVRLAQVGDSLRVDDVAGAAFAGAAYHTAALLADGDVLLAGGMPPGCAPPCASDLVLRYSASNHSIGSEASLIVGRLGHTATVQESGALLICGGLAEGPTLISASELLAPVTASSVDEFGRRAGEVTGPRCQ